MRQNGMRLYVSGSIRMGLLSSRAKFIMTPRKDDREYRRISSLAFTWKEEVPPGGRGHLPIIVSLGLSVQKHCIFWQGFWVLFAHIGNVYPRDPVVFQLADGEEIALEHNGLAICDFLV